MSVLKRSIRCISSIVLSLLICDVSALKLSPISHSDILTGGHTPSKRASNFTGNETLNLQNWETFYWGAYGAKNLIYANLTLFFPDDYEYVISMERFNGMLKSVVCSDQMMLQFKDGPSFEYAQGVWNWVNQDVNNTFIMVANYEGCGPEAERQPFLVSNIVYDPLDFKAYLTADQKTWTEIAHTYTLNLGHLPIYSSSRRLSIRDDPDFSMSLASSFDHNLFSTTVAGVDMSVDCVLRTAGQLNVDINIDVSWFKVSSAKMTISPEDVAASIDIALSESGTLSHAYSWQKTVISIPVEGIEIAGVVKLGAFLDVDVGFTLEEWKGEAHASVGARMAISNSAILVVDLVKSSNNRFSGWAPTFSSNPLTVSAKVEGAAQVFAEPNIKLEAEALGKGFEVGLNMKMPYIEMDFAGLIDSTGVCGGLQTLGVDVDASVGVDLFAQAATAGNEANPFWSQDIYSNTWPLFSKCFGFGAKNAHSGNPANPSPPARRTSKKKTTKGPKTTAHRGITSHSEKLTPTKTITKSKRTSTRAHPTSTKIPSVRESSKATATTNTSEPSSVSKAVKSSSRARTSSKSVTTNGDVSSVKTTGKTLLPTSHSDSSVTRTSDTLTVTTSVRSSSLTTSFSLSSSLSNFANSTRSRTSNPAETTLITTQSSLPSVSSTSSSVLSTSSAESCPITGCNTCQDIDDTDPETEEYLAIEGRSLGHSINERGDREYKYICSTVTQTVTLADYPSRANPSKISEWYKAAAPTVCTNMEIIATARPSDPAGFNTEHVYEGKWILLFLHELESKMSCEDIEHVFFTTPRAPTNNNRATSWSQALMESLGSTRNQELLAFLWKNINGEKARIFTPGNNIIADSTWRSSSVPQKLSRMARVGRALNYMADGAIGQKLGDTAKGVEDTLNAMVSSFSMSNNTAVRSALGPYATGQALAAEHRSWISSFVSSGNAKATNSVKRWASDISRTLETASTANPTISWLDKVKVTPPAGINVQAVL